MSAVSPSSCHPCEGRDPAQKVESRKQNHATILSMPRRSDCPSLRAAYAELLDLKQRCKLAIEEAKRTGNVDPATKLVMLCRQKAKELGQQVNPFWEKVDVTYEMPSMEKLKRRFNFGSILLGNSFEPIEVCRHVSREPQKIRFEYLHTEENFSMTKILAEMEQQDLRPALVEELIYFAEHYPDAWKMGWIVALGSSIMDGDDRCVAVLGSDSDGLILQSASLPLLSSWFTWDRFLVVRE